MLFISVQKLCSVLRCSNIYPDAFGHVGERLKKRDTVNFKIHDIINWETNNYSTLIVQYLKK